jgi:hypothetical protein
VVADDVACNRADVRVGIVEHPFERRSVRESVQVSEFVDGGEADDRVWVIKRREQSGAASSSNMVLMYPSPDRLTRTAGLYPVLAAKRPCRQG